mmetsp:Transcript_1551/g.4033  ORF Transcript_1551/g.4033 Transcript_1551/m.4033 type:complete len:217 (-) Transcript_1551:735-1385(-)
MASVSLSYLSPLSRASFLYRVHSRSSNAMGRGGSSAISCDFSIETGEKPASIDCWNIGPSKSSFWYHSSSCGLATPVLYAARRTWVMTSTTCVAEYDAPVSFSFTLNCTSRGLVCGTGFPSAPMADLAPAAAPAAAAASSATSSSMMSVGMCASPSISTITLFPARICSARPLAKKSLHFSQFSLVSHIRAVTSSRSSSRLLIIANVTVRKMDVLK